MELSKKVAYLKGLMEGLEIDTESPNGKILKEMTDILSDIADEVEKNSISEYIDTFEDGADPLNEIDTYKYGFDPVKGDTAAYSVVAPTEKPDGWSGSKAVFVGEDDESFRFSEMLGSIVSEPEHGDEVPSGGDYSSFKLIETLKNMVVRSYEEQELEEAKKRAEGLPVPHILNDKKRYDFISKLEDLLSSISDEEDEEDNLDSVIGRMRCPFCHRDIQFKSSDIAEKIIECPCCGNNLTIML